MSSIGGLGRFFNTARTAWCRLVETQTIFFLKNHKSQMNSKKKKLGALDQAVHQAVSKKRPKPPMQCNAGHPICFKKYATRAISRVILNFHETVFPSKRMF
jgi:hypothetical protein